MTDLAPPLPTVTARIYLTSVYVYINGTLHLCFRRAWFAGLISRRDAACFTLEISLAQGGPLVARYEREEIWRLVLSELERLDITAN